MHCEDDCPNCGARHMTPYESDDLTTVLSRMEVTSSSFSRLKLQATTPTIANSDGFRRSGKPRRSYLRIDERLPLR